MPAARAPGMLIDNPWFYLAAIPAVVLTGISKSGFGGVAGGISVPIMALVISPVQAAAIMLPILCVMDIASIIAYRKIWDRRNLAIILPAALLGILIGTFTFEYLTDDVVRLIVGTIAVLFALYNWIGRRFFGRAEAPPTKRNLVKGTAAGIVSGFTSFVAHSGGPPLQIYLLPQRIDKTLYVGTTVVFFLVVNYVKLVPYALIGQFSGINLVSALVLLPLAPLGVWLGLRLHRMVPEGLFYRIAYVMLFATGVKLVWDGLSNTLA